MEVTGDADYVTYDVTGAGVVVEAYLYVYRTSVKTNCFGLECSSA